MGIARLVAEKAPKAAAKSTSNHSPVSHGGPNPLCGLGILGSPQIRLSAAGGSSHALSRASGCRSRSAAQLFCPAINMGNLLLRRDDVPATKLEHERSIALQPDFGNAQVHLGQLFAQSGDWTSALAQYETAIRFYLTATRFSRAQVVAINRRKFAVAIGHGRNWEQFLYVGGAVWGRPFFLSAPSFLSANFDRLCSYFWPGLLSPSWSWLVDQREKAQNFCPRPIVAWAPLWIVE